MNQNRIKPGPTRQLLADLAHAFLAFVIAVVIGIAAGVLAMLATWEPEPAIGAVLGMVIAMVSASLVYLKFRG